MKSSELFKNLFELILEGDFEKAEGLWQSYPQHQNIQFGFDAARSIIQLDMSEKIPALKWLLEHYPGVTQFQEAADYTEGDTLLHWAVLSTRNATLDPEVFQLLLDHGASLEAQTLPPLLEDPFLKIYGGINMAGSTPLLSCAESGNDILLSLLLQHPINRFATTEAGHNFLDVLGYWANRIAQSKEGAEACLKLWLEDEVGQDMMREKCQDEEALQVFLTSFPSITESFLAHDQARHLREKLSAAPSPSPKAKL